jgi:hypothetical protein
MKYEFVLPVEGGDTEHIHTYSDKSNHADISLAHRISYDAIVKEVRNKSTQLAYMYDNGYEIVLKCNVSYSETLSFTIYSPVPEKSDML